MALIKHDERYGPYMTANNAPAPYAATASQNSYGAFRAFSESLDDDISFTGLGAGTEQWVQIKLDAPIRIWAFRIACRTTVSAKDSGQVPKNFTVQGSTDGTNFVDIQSYSDMPWEQFTSWNAEILKYDWADAKKIEIACNAEYQYYRFLFGECQAIGTQKSGSMTPAAASTVKPTLIDLYQVEGEDSPEVTVTGIRITHDPDKVRYEAGADLDTTGLEVTADLSDGTTQIITDYTLSGFDSSTVGTKTVTVTYQGHTATFTVMVDEVNVVREFLGNPTLEDIEAVLDLNTGVLTISGTGNMMDFTYSQMPFQENKKNIKTVEILKGITSIGSNVFCECSALTSVTIPEGVTVIGESAFDECSALTSVTIPKGVTVIGALAFDECSALTNIAIPEGVTSIGVYAFYGCSALTNIAIPEGVTSIEASTFNSCSALENISIPVGVIEIGVSAFKRCTKLKELSIPEGVISIGSYAFSGCTALESIILPRTLDTIGQSVFEGCKQTLESIYIKAGTWTNAYFADFVGLKSIRFGDGIETLPISMCAGCVNLAQVIMDEGVKIISESAFSGCTSITDINLPSTITAIKDHAFPDCTGIKCIEFPENVVSIGTDVFYGCENSLEEVRIKAAETIGRNLFYRFKALKKVHFGEGVKIIPENICHECTALTEAILSEGIETIGSGAFYGCDSLTSVTIPSTVRGTIAYDAFGWCAKLSEIIFHTTRDCNLSSTFRSLPSLKNLVIPEIGELNYTVFTDCIGLETVRIGYAKKIDSGCFSVCTSLESAYLNAVQISSGAFPACIKLKYVEFGPDVKSVSGFNACTGIEEIDIPANVETLGQSAFSGCTSLGKIRIYNPNIEIADEANTISDSATIYGYRGSTAQNYAKKYGRTFIPLGVYSIKISTPPTKTEYTIGEELDLTGLIVKLVYDTGEEEEITDYTLSGFDSSAAGTCTVVVTYEGQSASFEVTVEAAAEIMVTGIRVTHLPNKVAYQVGEALDAAGLEVTADLSDGSSRVVTDYTLSGFDSSTAGIKTVTVERQDQNVGFKVIVSAATSGVTLESLLNTTEGMEVIRNNVKNSGTTDAVTGVDWFTYVGYICSTIYVNGNNWIGFGVSDNHLRISYSRYGSVYYLYRQEGMLDTGLRFLKIRVEGYSQASTNSAYRLVYEVFLFDNGYMYINVVQSPTALIGASYIDGKSTGIKELKIPEGVTASNPFGITVEDAGKEQVITYERYDPFIAAGIVITTLPAKVSYYGNELFDDTELSASLADNDGNKRSVADYELSGFDNSLPGIKTVTIGKNDVMDTFLVKVLDTKIVGLMVAKMPDKTVYIPKSTLDTAGIEVSFVLSDGRQIPADRYTISSLDSSEPGEKEITITYAQFVATFCVTVLAEESIEVTQLPDKTRLIVGDIVDLYDGIVVTAYYENGESQRVDGFTLSNPDMSILGEQTITVTYRDCVCYFTITVSDTVIEEIGYESSSITASLNVRTGLLTISGTGETKTFRTSWGISLFLWGYQDKVTEAVIGEGITKITNLFYVGQYDGFVNLRKVTLPNTLTEIIKTDEGCFSGCTELTEINIPESLTIINGFDGCTGLTELTLGKNVSLIGEECFKGCPDLVLTIQNPECEIYDSSYTLEVSKIRGCGASTASDYAILYNLPFESIEADIVLGTLESLINKVNGMYSVSLTAFTHLDPAPIVGVDWFSYDVYSAQIIYATNYNAVRFGGETGWTFHLRMLYPSQDYSPWVTTVYRQEGILLNGMKCLKIRLESNLTGNDLPDGISWSVYEVFFLETGDFFISVISSAQENYNQESNLTCGDKTYNLDIPMGITPDKPYYISFYKDGNGYNIKYEFYSPKGLTPQKVVIAAPPTKTEYTIGEELDLTGLIVKLVYDTGEEREITTYTLSGYDSTKTGQQAVTVTYHGVAAEFYVFVGALLPTGIIITKYPDKRVYAVGEAFDSTGLQVSLAYNSGKAEPVTDYVLSGFDSSTVGAKTINIAYTPPASEGEITDILETSFTVTVTQKGENPFTDPNKDWDIRLHWPDGRYRDVAGDEIEGESLTLVESICNDSNFRFGGCVSTQMSVNLFSSQFLSPEAYPEGDIEVYLETDGESLLVFTGTIESADRTSSLSIRRLVAYDYLKRKGAVKLKSWYQSLAFPITQKDFRNSLFAYIGIEQLPANLMYDDAYVPDNMPVDSLTFLALIKDICLVNMCFGHINARGQFEYLFLTPNAFWKDGRHQYRAPEEVIPEEEYTSRPTFKEGKIWYPHLFFKIPDPYYPVQIEAEPSDLASYEGNIYYVRNSYMIGDSDWIEKSYTMTETQDTSGFGQTIYAPKYPLIYGPQFKQDDYSQRYLAQEYSLTVRGNPYRKIGTYIQFPVTKYLDDGTEIRWVIRSYIMSRTLKGINHMRDTYTARNSAYNEEAYGIGKDTRDNAVEIGVLKKNVPKYKIYQQPEARSAGTEVTSGNLKGAYVMDIGQYDAENYEPGVIYYLFEG